MRVDNLCRVITFLRGLLVPPGELVRRLHGSAVGWLWVYNALRLASGVIILPLALHKFTKSDLGMYYVFLSQAAIVTLVDFGFGPTVGRFVSYAMGGARSIQARGVPEPSATTDPNYPLLWQILYTTRRLYGYLTLVLLVILLSYGTYLVELKVMETSSPMTTRIAWSITIMSAAFDVYANWWGVFLAGMNQVRASARIGVAAMSVRLVVSLGLFLGGAGLMSLPLGTMCGSFLQRWLARRACLRQLAPRLKQEPSDTRAMLKILWPNSWRVGIQFLGGYLTANANTAICTMFFGLEATAVYGLSVQLLTISAGMAGVWTATKWPIIGQYHARHDLESLRSVLWPRVWLQNLSFLAAIFGLLLAGPFLLRHFGAGKEILPLTWLALLALNSFFELQFNIWGTLLTLENRVPYLWPTVATNVLSLQLTLIFVGFTDLGLGALVVGPLLAGALFNYWFWPPYAARSIGTSFFKFLCRGWKRADR
jgi:O-antigen/teichoic acid export membrane protein